MQLEVFLSPSLIVVGYEIAQRIKEGWEIDDNCPLTQIGWQFEIGFIKYSEDEKAVENLKEEAFPIKKAGRPPKKDS